jgi:hypothetical protein
VTLVCTVSSNLAITSVQWQRNIGGSITTITSNTKTNKYSGSTTTTPSLTIFSVQQSDVGTYTCFGSNSVGTGQSTTTTLSVTGSRYICISKFVIYNEYPRYIQRSVWFNYVFIYDTCKWINSINNQFIKLYSTYLSYTNVLANLSK